MIVDIMKQHLKKLFTNIKMLYRKLANIVNM